jgi:isoleucyl-tRNA synthetase
MEVYDLSGACATIESVLDALNNWYIRRSRDRFWGTGSADAGASQDAFDTLATVLEVVCRVAAPLLPLVTESVWLGLTGGDQAGMPGPAAGSAPSVHLADWPDPSSLPSDPDLVADMDWVRDICSAAHSIRKANGLRARLPLAGLTVAAPDADRLRPYVGLIADELNVKDVALTEDEDRYASRNLIVTFKVAAPRLGPATQAAAAAAKRGDWEVLDGGRARVGASMLEPNEFELRVQPIDETSTRALGGQAGLVILDMALTEDLLLEGVGRDLVRAVQQQRRDLGLEVTDRIRLEVAGDARVLGAIEVHEHWIAEQVLATEIMVVAEPAGPEWHQVRLADQLEAAIRVTTVTGVPAPS